MISKFLKASVAGLGLAIAMQAVGAQDMGKGTFKKDGPTSEFERRAKNGLMGVDYPLTTTNTLEAERLRAALVAEILPALKKLDEKSLSEGPPDFVQRASLETRANFRKNPSYGGHLSNLLVFTLGALYGTGQAAPYIRDLVAVETRTNPEAGVVVTESIRESYRFNELAQRVLYPDSLGRTPRPSVREQLGISAPSLGPLSTTDYDSRAGDTISPELADKLAEFIEKGGLRGEIPPPGFTGRLPQPAKAPGMR